jgi:hypothetical protein
MPSRRSDLIHKAAALPVGHPDRKTLLKRLGADYSGDPNVSLSGVVYAAQKVFVEDVAKAILLYSGKGTPVQGKSGATFMRGSTAHGGLVNRTRDGEWTLGIEVKVRGDVVEVQMESGLSDSDLFRFSEDKTPASIASLVSWVGKAYLLGEPPRR